LLQKLLAFQLLRRRRRTSIRDDNLITETFMTKSQAISLLDEWASASIKLRQLNEKLESEIGEHRAQFEAAVAPIRERFSPKIQSIESKINGLENEIFNYLRSKGQPLQITSSKAIAANEVRVGRRNVPVKKFIEVAASKGDAMYDALQVQIAKAERLLGKDTIDQIADKKTEIVQTIKLLDS
jgi:hypothetical protein